MQFLLREKTRLRKINSEYKLRKKNYQDRVKNDNEEQ